MEKEIVPGHYRHFKGGVCNVIGVARHSETTEEFVVYEHLAEPQGLWIRPKKMFLESVEVNGKLVPRFKFVGE